MKKETVLKTIFLVIYFLVFYKILDYLFYLWPMPLGVLLNVLEVLAIALALLLSVALATFTTNKICRKDWLEKEDSEGE